MKKTLLILFISFVSTLLTVLIIFSAKGDELVIKLVQPALNKSLNTTATASSVNFSLFKRFPNASIEIKNLNVQNPTTAVFQSKQLFSSESIVINISMVDLIKKNKLVVKKIEINKANFNYELNNDNVSNLKSLINKSVDDSNSFSFEVNRILFNDFLLCYKSKEFSSDFSINKLSFKADNSSDFSGLVKADFMVDPLKIDKKLSLHKEQFFLKSNIQISEDEINLINLKLTNRGTHFSGSLSLLPNKLGQSNIVLNTNKLSLGKYRDILDSYVPNYIKYRDGYLKLNVSVDDFKKPKILLSGYSDNLNLTVKDQPILLDMKFGFKYNYGWEINFQKLIAYNGSSSLQLKGGLNNFYQTSISTSFSMDAGLIKSFLPSYISQANGFISGNIDFNSNKKFRKFKSEIFVHFNPHGKVYVKNGNLNFNSQDYQYSNIDAAISLDQYLSIDSLSFNIEESDFKIRGNAHNYLEYFLLENENLEFDLSLKSSYLTLDKHLNIKTSDKAEPKPIVFPSDLKGKIELEISKLDVNKFAAKNIESRLSYLPGKLNVAKTNFEAFEGAISGGGVIIQKFDKSFVLRSQYNLSGLRIDEVFQTFNNFKQNTITSDNLKGDFSGDLFLNLNFEPNLEPRMENLDCKIEALIENGRIINFEPLYKLSAYVDKEQLADVKFKTLRNYITIKDNILSVPAMSLESSLMDAEVSGQQNFNGLYHYDLTLYLSDIIYNSNNDDIKGNVVEESPNRYAIFLDVDGNKGESSVKYDFTAHRKALSGTIKSHKENFKNLFKKKTTKKDTKKQENTFKIEWEE